ESDKAHITLEEAALLLKLKDDPARLRKVAGAYDIRREIEAVLAEKAYYVAVDRLVADAKADGVTVVQRAEGKKATYATVGNWCELDFGRKNNVHVDEPCHAVLTPRPGWSWAAPKALEAVCAEPKRHAKGGASKLKISTGRASTSTSVADAERKEEERLRRQATAARTLALQELLAGEIDTASATRIILGRFLDVSWASTRKLADRLLASELPARGAALGSIQDQVRLALAVALAGLEEQARGTYGGGVPPALMEVLAGAGYQLTEWDRRRATAAAGDPHRADLFDDDEGRTVDDDPPTAPPQEALAWYRGYADDDPSRWLTDPDEVETLLSLFPDRVEPMPGDAAGIRACRACGCTDDHACSGGCSWAEADLCSACVPADVPVATAAAS
ncbi:MAG: hypothetical protein QOD63_3077, partial [Actinomycetota bacterium]|nr:hypothetical protein [Actinomycetota bacterium]